MPSLIIDNYYATSKMQVVYIYTVLIDFIFNISYLNQVSGCKYVI